MTHAAGDRAWRLGHHHPRKRSESGRSDLIKYLMRLSPRKRPAAEIQRISQNSFRRALVADESIRLRRVATRRSSYLNKIPLVPLHPAAFFPPAGAVSIGRRIIFLRTWESHQFAGAKAACFDLLLKCSDVLMFLL